MLNRFRACLRSAVIEDVLGVAGLFVGLFGALSLLAPL